jgi:hypothetical protein
MDVSKELYFRAKEFAAGELVSAAERVCSRVCGPDYSVSVSLYRTLGDGTQQSQSGTDSSILSTICNIDQEDVRFKLRFQKRHELGYIIHEFGSALVSAKTPDVLRFSVDADSIDHLRDLSHAFEEEFKLEAVPEPFTEIEERRKVLSDIDALAERVATLERDRAASHQLTCFLSFRFEGRSVDYGRMVKQFLELLDVKVITGQGYEPMPVNLKVRSRLAESLDVIVVIETADGKSSWTRDEMARAQNPGVFLIPLVEDGATFDAGIFGDHEYIPFAQGHVSDAFIGLIEGIQYVGRIRASAMRIGT